MRPAVRYCGGLSASPLAFLSALLKGRASLETWKQLAGRHVLFTHKGRGAVVLAVKALGLKPGDEILVPAYNCGAELEALAHAGLQVVLYRVDSNTQIDLDDAQRRVTAKTRALYVIHYFG